MARPHLPIRLPLPLMLMFPDLPKLCDHAADWMDTTASQPQSSHYCKQLLILGTQKS